MAEVERITLNEVYDLNTINFLNDLAYLKDKAKEDKELHKRWLQSKKQ